MYYLYFFKKGAHLLHSLLFGKMCHRKPNYINSLSLRLDTSLHFLIILKELTFCFYTIIINFVFRNITPILNYLIFVQSALTIPLFNRIIAEFSRIY